MNRAQLLQPFDTLAETPDAVEKLRAFVFVLAVRGLLVSQNTKDESGVELLKRILDEKRRLTRESVIKKTPILEPITADTCPFVIPKNWAWAYLNDFGDWGSGSTPIRTNHEFYDGTIPWLKSGELNDGIVSESEEKVTELALEKCSLRLNKPGDVLFAMYGATVGKVAILGVEATTNQAVCACTCFSGVFNRYLFVLLKAFKQQFISESAGAAQPNFSKDKIIRTVAPLPPLAEQRRIVAKVEELLALCDALEEAQTAAREHRTRLVRSALDHLTTAPGARAVPARSASVGDIGLENFTAPEHSQPLRAGTARAPQDDFRRHAAFVLNEFPGLTAAPEDLPALRQAILSLAVQGHMVPQSSRDGTGADAVKKVLKRRGLQPSTQGKASEDLPQLPATWTAVAMADIFEVVGGIQKTPLRAPRDNAFPYLRVANVQRGRLNLADVQKFQLLDVELDRWRLEPKDVLLVEGNGSEDEIGRCAQWQGELRDCVHQNHIIRCRPFGHDAKFALLFLNSPVGIAEMKRRAITTSGLYSLSVGKIRSLTVPFPPLAEQQRIVAKVDELLRWCDALEARLTAARTTATHLLDASLHQILAA